jgi:hypothetical protein
MQRAVARRTSASISAAINSIALAAVAGADSLPALDFSRRVLLEGYALAERSRIVEPVAHVQLLLRAANALHLVPSSVTAGPVSIATKAVTTHHMGVLLPAISRVGNAVFALYMREIEGVGALARAAAALRERLLRSVSLAEVRMLLEPPPRTKVLLAELEALEVAACVLSGACAAPRRGCLRLCGRREERPSCRRRLARAPAFSPPQSSSWRRAQARTQNKPRRACPWTPPRCPSTAPRRSPPRR